MPSVAGIVASRLKGGDYEEVIVLGVLLLVLHRARPAFDRRAALFATRFSPGGSPRSRRAPARYGSGSLPSNTSTTDANCGGSSRSPPGVTISPRGRWARRRSCSCFAVARLSGTRRTKPSPPSDADLDAASRALAASALDFSVPRVLRDKALLFNERA